jgi:hypothetical protein
MQDGGRGGGGVGGGDVLAVILTYGGLGPRIDSTVNSRRARRDLKDCSVKGGASGDARGPNPPRRAFASSPQIYLTN